MPPCLYHSCLAAVRGAQHAAGLLQAVKGKLSRAQAWREENVLKRCCQLQYFCHIEILTLLVLWVKLARWDGWSLFGPRCFPSTVLLYWLLLSFIRTKLCLQLLSFFPKTTLIRSVTSQPAEKRFRFSCLARQQLLNSSLDLDLRSVLIYFEVASNFVH